MESTFDASVLVLKILSCIYRAEEKYGVYMIAAVVCGSQNKKIQKFGLDKLSTFDVVKDYSTAQVMAVMRYLLETGFIFRSAQYKNLKFTPKGKLFLKNKPQLFVPTKILEKTRTPLFAEALSGTHFGTLTLWQHGKNIQDIATIRHLTPNTIVDHLADLIFHRKINHLNIPVDKHKVNLIKTVWEKNPDSSLKELKTHLPEDISYGQIKMVVASLSK